MVLCLKTRESRSSPGLVNTVPLPSFSALFNRLFRRLFCIRNSCFCSLKSLVPRKAVCRFIDGFCAFMHGRCAVFFLALRQNLYGLSEVFNMLARLKCAPILFLKTVCRFATFLTRLFVLKRLLFLFRKSLLRRFADCDFCVVSGVLRDEARTCLANAHTPQSVPETPVIPYMKPSSDSAIPFRFSVQLQGTVQSGRAGRRRARAFRGTGRAHQRHVKLGGAFEREKSPRAQNGGQNAGRGFL